MPRKTIICLANSRKPPSGRCIAGKVMVDDAFHEWLRPVSARDSHEVSEEERRYENGAKAKLLDIVSVPLLRACPSGHQVENSVLDDGFYWKKRGRATWEQVMTAVDAHDPSFWSNSQSTYHGLRDKISEANVAAIGSSLKMILLPEIVLQVRREDGFKGNDVRRRVRAGFTYKNLAYLLSVSDPRIEEEYLAKADGSYTIADAAVCISVVEVWNGFAFRVVASIITQEMC